MNDKLIQLVERLWNIEPCSVCKNTIDWKYRDYNIQLAKCTNKEFRIYIIKGHRYLIAEDINISEEKYLTWKINLIKAFNKFSNNLLDTLLEEEDASCFDDLLETNKNE